MSKRDEKYQADRVTRGKIKKIARLRDHPATPDNERRASFFATERLVKRLNYGHKSYERYFRNELEMEFANRLAEFMRRNPAEP
jgi:hypothetical protein